MGHCTSCGVAVGDDARFCPRCGVALDRPRTDPSPFETASVPAAKTRAARRVAWLPLALLAGGALALAGVLFALRGGGPAAPAGDAATPASGEPAGPASSAPATAVATPTPRPTPPIEATFYARRGFEFDVDPEDATVTIGGTEVLGRADDWDGKGGGRVYYPRRGVTYVKLSQPGYRTAWVKLVLTDRANEDVEDIGTDLRRSR